MKIIKTLKKLIAHEQSARSIGNINEAAAFAERIQQLLTRHNLSMSEVEIHDAESSIVGIESVQEDFSNIENWQRLLLNTIAGINGCHSLEHSAGFQVIVGRKTDREIVINLFHHFQKLALELADNYMQERAYGVAYTGLFFDTVKSAAARRNSFLLGFVSKISQRLEETNKKNIAESENSTALVFLGSRETDNQTFIKENLDVQNIEPEIEDSQIDTSSFLRGVQTGDSVALTDKTLK